MGILLIGNVLASFIGGLIPGLGSFLLFRHYHDQQEREVWRRYTLYACIGGLALVGIGVLQLPSASSGAPSGSDYAGAATAASLIGFAPGGGLVLGCLAALTQSEE